MKKNLLWTTLFAGAAIMYVPNLGRAQTDALHQEITNLFQYSWQKSSIIQKISVILFLVISITIVSFDFIIN